MKSIILLIALCFSMIKVNAQSPTATTCNGAVEVSPAVNCNYSSFIFEPTQSSFWITFEAGTGLNQFTLKHFNDNSGQSILITSIEVYSGICDSLVLDTTISNPTYDSTYSMSELFFGNTYFIKINRNILTECPTGCIENKGLELCFKVLDISACIAYWIENPSQPVIFTTSCGWSINVSNCTVSMYECEQICWLEGCFMAQYSNGDLNWIISDNNGPIQGWLFPAMDNDITCFNPTVPGTYTLTGTMTSPSSQPFIFHPLTINVLPITVPTDAISFNNVCTYQDLVTASAYSWSSSSFSHVEIDGVPFYGYFLNYPSYQSYFNSLAVGSHTICNYWRDECLNLHSFCENFNIVTCNPVFNAIVNCNVVAIINSTAHQSSFISWTWDFGDGTTSNVANPGTHIYNTPGTYTITLTAVDNIGNTYTVTQTVTPIFGQPMTLNLPENSCCVAPEISVNNDYNNYQWTINPTVLWSGSNNIIYPVFDPNTNYEICVTAIDNINGCPVSACGNIKPCCGFNSELIPVPPTSQDNHIIGTNYFTQNCEPETVSNLIANYGWSTVMPQNITIVLRNDLIVDEDITFGNLLVRIDEGKKIIIKPGVTQTSCTLTVNKTHLTNACDYMWEGIVLDDVNAQLVITNGSFVTQAQNAVVSNFGAKYILFNSTFLNNYKSVVVNGFNNTHPGGIGQCIFNGTPNDMLSPHNNDFLPFVGVEINKVKEITVGTAIDPFYVNTFQRLKYGILSTASNVHIINNEFKNINVISGPFSNQINNTDAIAIWAKNGYAAGPTQFINIGNTGTSKNKFSNSKKGIQIEGNISSVIIGNEFKDIQITNIYCRNTNGKAINILNNTMSGKFGVGVLCVNFLKSIVQIKINLIDENSGYNHAPSYHNTGIWLANAIANPSLYQIENNQIFRCENGIIADGVPTVLIKNNSVIFQRNNNQMINTGAMHRGIWLKNSRKAELTLNAISRTNLNSPAFDGTAAMTNVLHGITVELSEESYVHDNNMTRLGYGMLWRGSSINSTISCNIMQRCYNGIYFDFAEVGHQGSPTNPSGNYWVSNQSVNEKMNGILNITNFPITNWYAVLSGNTNPNIHNVDPTTLFVLSATGNANCQIAPGGTTPGPIGPGKREALFGSIVRDEKQFLNFENETRQQNRRYAYRLLKENPSWINLGAPDDGDYQNFFATMINENDGKMEDVNSLIADTNFNAASLLNSSIIPALIAESNHKTVTEIYLSTWANNLEIDSVQFYILEGIACQNPLEGGPAVYGARVMIGLDYECSNGANRNMLITDDVGSDSENEREFKIYPNPSNGLFTISSNSTELVNGKVLIFDITGKNVAEFKLNSSDATQINISELADGMYNYFVYSNGASIYSDKLVILR